MSQPWLTMKSLKPWRRKMFSPVQMGTSEYAQSRLQPGEYSTCKGSSNHTGLIDLIASAICIEVRRSYSQWQWTMMS